MSGWTAEDRVARLEEVVVRLTLAFYGELMGTAGNFGNPPTAKELDAILNQLHPDNLLDLPPRLTPINPEPPK